MTSTALTRRRTLGLAAGTVGTALAGCLGAVESDDSGGTGELGNPAEHVEVETMSIPQPKLEPALVHIEPGGTVEWVGQGQRNAVVAYHPDADRARRVPEGARSWVSGTLREGSRFSVTFETPGIHDYADPVVLCGTHEAFGVVGRVVVGWPDLDEEPAVTHDNDELPSLATNAMDEFDRRCREVLGDGG
jgi:plastocyanin